MIGLFKPTAASIATLIAAITFLSYFVSAPSDAAEPVASSSGSWDPASLSGDDRVAIVGGGTAERINLFGHFEAAMQFRFNGPRPDGQHVTVRNFAWPTDTVDQRIRPGNYTKIDDPFKVYDPNVYLCFFGTTEAYQSGTQADGSIQPEVDGESIDRFIAGYQKYIDQASSGSGNVRMVLFSPVAFESTGDPLRPDGVAINQRLKAYRDAVEKVAATNDVPFVDLFTETATAFEREPGAQFTVNGRHLNEAGNALMAKIAERSLFGDVTSHDDRFAKVRRWVEEKSWLHLQDYRMLNGWYVYGGRRTWDTETFPTEFQKIRAMVAVRDRYIADIVAGRQVAETPDDSSTGEVFIPETMFGSRDEAFREMREPETLVYPTADQTIADTTVPDGFEMQCFASEADFPELANPTQIAFDSNNRLWVSCMVNYPQWLPGGVRPDDRLLILEDTDGDGKADSCKTFYDELICPTGFEFYRDGVLVIDEPRIIFLRDTDGDDVADEVTHLVDGIGTDDTHHAMGAWEYSPGGRLHLLEGIAMSTTVESPRGPVIRRGASGSYVWDVETDHWRHFRTPGYGNPWCLVWDRHGNGIIGDGTNANQIWTSLLSGGEVDSRASVDAIFNNRGIRPAAGNEMLTTRQFPDEYHDRLTYSCVINLHGMPMFTINDIDGMSGLGGQYNGNLIESKDKFFRPVDPKIGPDGALWFGDWCNALIGHMQYSQRDPNRDHQHGRIYRLVNTKSDLLEPLDLATASIDRLLDELRVFEPRTRYRVRRELRSRDRDAVLAAVDRFVDRIDDDDALREALWIQEGLHQIDAGLVERLMRSDDFRIRSATVHAIGNQWRWMNDPATPLAAAAKDDHPRVRLETARACSLWPTRRSLEILLTVAAGPRDKWLDYVINHSMKAIVPDVTGGKDGEAAFVASLNKDQQKTWLEYQMALDPNAAILAPMKVMSDVDAKTEDVQAAIAQVVAARHGNSAKGRVVFNRLCSACHKHGDLGKKFGPELTGLGDRMTKEHILRSIFYPNEEISKGYQTVSVLDLDGVVTNGFVLEENDDEIKLGIADGKTKTIVRDDIELIKEMKASSMPEGLMATVAPSELTDLLAFLSDGWIATNPNLDFNLQKHGDDIEVSRQTHVRLGRGFPSNLNREAEHLLSHEGIRKYTFAVHSSSSGKDNAIDIRFNDPTVVRYVKVFNRREKQFYDRADGLTFWASDDGKTYRKIWSADKPRDKWEFKLDDETPIKFLKVGLDRVGIFHLDRITLYGEVIQPTP